MNAWLNQMFDAAAANGGIVRRARSDVDRYASLEEVVGEAQKREFHVIETGGQVVVLCHPGQVILLC